MYDMNPSQEYLDEQGCAVYIEETGLERKLCYLSIKVALNGNNSHAL